MPVLTSEVSRARCQIARHDLGQGTQDDCLDYNQDARVLVCEYLF